MISVDGSATMTGPWGTVTNAQTSFDGDRFCYVGSNGGRICGNMFQNPGGSPALMNEMIRNLGDRTFTFSPID